MLDLRNPELTYTADDDEVLPASAQQQFKGVPRSIRSLATFYNPNPQDESENRMGEAPVFVQEINEAAYLTTVYDGNPVPKKAQKCHSFSNWWEAMCTEFRNMEHQQVWESTPNTSVPTGKKAVGSLWVLARNDDPVVSDLVASDSTLNLLTLIKSMSKLEAGQFDIERAFSILIWYTRGSWLFQKDMKDT
jgi:hypothetical protein